MAESAVLAKLRMKAGQKAVVLDPPQSYASILATIPKDVELAGGLDGKLDFIHIFATKKADLARRIPELKDAMKPESVLWVSYPKGKAVPTDLNRDSLRELVESTGGLKAVAQVAIDEVWSALRFKIV